MTRKLYMLGATSALLLALAGCGSNDDDNNDNRVDNNTPPGAPGATGDSFIAALQGILATSPDDAEPVSIDTFAITSPEDNEPIPT